MKTELYEVRRYSDLGYGGGCHEDSDGAYVKYEDYEELLCEAEGAGIVGYMCPACFCCHNHAPTDDGLPTIDHLEAIFDNAYGATKSDHKALEAVVAELAPFLRKPVPCAECAKWEAYAVRLQNDCEDYNGRLSRVRAALDGEA